MSVVSPATIAAIRQRSNPHKPTPVCRSSFLSPDTQRAYGEVCNDSEEDEACIDDISSEGEESIHDDISKSSSDEEEKAESRDVGVVSSSPPKVVRATKRK